MLADGAIVAKTPEEGVEFYVKDGKLLFTDLLFGPRGTGAKEYFIN